MDAAKRIYALIPATALSSLGTNAFMIVADLAFARAFGIAISGVVVGIAVLIGVLASSFILPHFDRIKGRKTLLLIDFIGTTLNLVGLGLALVTEFINPGFMQGTFGLVFIVVLSFVMASSIYGPISRGMVPQYLGTDKERITHYNSRFAAVRALSSILGPWVATAAIIFDEHMLAAAFTINALSYVISFALTLIVPDRNCVEEDAEEETAWQKFTSSIKLIRKHPHWMSILESNLVFAFLCSAAVYLIMDWAHGATDGILYSSVLGVFALSGGLISFVKPLTRSSQIAPMFVLAAAFLVSLIPAQPLFFVAYALMGGATTIYNIVTMSKLQAEIPLEYTSRIMGFLTIITQLAMPLGNALWGIAVQFCGWQMVSIIISATMLTYLILRYKKLSWKSLPSVVESPGQKVEDPTTDGAK